MREILGSMVPLSPAPQELPAPASYLTAWRGEEQLGTFTIHAPSGRRTSARSPSRGRTAPAPAGSCPPPKSGPWTAFGARSWTMKRPRPNRSRAAIQAPQAWVCGHVRRSDPAFAREMERLFQRDFQDSSLWLSEWLAYQSQGTLDQWYDLERARALSLTGRDGAVFHFL